MRISLHRLHFLAVLTTAALVRASVPEPPLPGEEGPVPPAEAFDLLPLPGDVPPPAEAGVDGEIAPPAGELAPPAPAPESMPDLPPVQGPSDGEDMPPLPAVPGLIPPPRVRPSAPGDPKPPAENVQPVNPDLPELAAQIRWLSNPRLARRQSIAERKPLLMYFRSPIGTNQALEDDLLLLPEFKELAAAKLVLTRLDYPTGTGWSNMTEARREALTQFRDYFKVRGFPTLILLDERGHEMTRNKGYSRLRDNNGVMVSTAHVILDKFKSALQRWEDRHRHERERMVRLHAQGYRLWKSTAGSALMGKFLEATAQGVVLMDEEGRRRGVLPQQLTLLDREWVRRTVRREQSASVQN